MKEWSTGTINYYTITVLLPISFICDFSTTANSRKEVSDEKVAFIFYVHFISIFLISLSKERIVSPFLYRAFFSDVFIFLTKICSL